MRFGLVPEEPVSNGGWPTNICAPSAPGFICWVAGSARVGSCSCAGGGTGGGASRAGLGGGQVTAGGAPELGPGLDVQQPAYRAAVHTP
jgi:hypothetical protein